MVSQSCQDCGLWKSCATYKQKVVVSEKTDYNYSETILVVGNHPSAKDDFRGVVYHPSTPRGKFLREDFLDYLPAKWVLTTASRCYGETVTKENYQLCSQYLTEVIQLHKPYIVICLGLDALESVMGPGCTSQSPIKVNRDSGGEMWVIPSFPPEDHAGKEDTEKYDGPKNLGDHIVRVVEWCESLLSKRFDAQEFTYERIFNEQEALDIARSVNSDRVCFDTETDHSDEGDTKRTIYHPDSSLILASMSWWDEDQSRYRNYTLEGGALTGAVIKEFCRNRVVEGHNINYDISVADHFLGVDLFEIASATRDTMLLWWAADQSSIRNDLKGLVQQHFFVEDWSQELDILKKEAIAAKDREINGPIRERNAARRKERAKLGMWAGVDCEPAITEMGFDFLKIPEEQRVLLRDEPLVPIDIGYAAVDRNKLAKYCALDTYWCCRFSREILDTRPDYKQPNDLAMLHLDKSRWCLWQIEKNGLPISRQAIAELKQTMEKKVREIHLALMNHPLVIQALASDKEVQRMTGVWSRMKKNKEASAVSVWMRIAGERLTAMGHWVKRVAEMFCTPEELAEIPKTKGGDLSINDEVIEILAGGVDDHESIHQKSSIELLWYYTYWFRKHQNLLDKFIAGFAAYEGADGRIHSSFALHRAVTGRTASSPNVQNLKKDVLVRRCFVARPGWVFCELDYDRMEPTVLSVVADAKFWKEAIRNDWDLYCLTAMQVYEDELNAAGMMPDLTLLAEEVKAQLDAIKANKETKSYREDAKTNTLATVYGQHPKTLAVRTGKPVEQVEAFARKFWKTNSEITAFVKRMHAILDRGDFVVTSFKRKRYFPKSFGKERTKLKNQIVNTGIQGDGSDIALWQTYRVLKWIDANHLQNKIAVVNFVHDALYFEVREDCVEELMPLIKAIMEDISSLPFNFDVPVRTSYKTGKSLADML